MEKKKFTAGLFLWIVMGCIPILAKGQDSLVIIPAPTSLQQHLGYFRYPEKGDVYVSQELQEEVDLLRNHPNIRFDIPHKLKSRKKLPEKGIFLLLATAEDRLPPNGYQLLVDTAKLVMIVHNREEILYALASLEQIAYTQEFPDRVPVLQLTDSPLLPQRGLMLDVSQHFFPIPFLKQLIDLMALYKLNTFYWHLADEGGWRLEIKKYPKLTEEAAWRDIPLWKDWSKSERHYSSMGFPNASGGFYTQEEVRDFVAYAEQKGITVVPELELLEHNEEVLAVYPALSCSGKAAEGSALCMGKAESVSFVQDILDEAMELFPATDIHLGGIDLAQSAWKSCPDYQKFLTDHQLKNEEDLYERTLGQILSHLKEHHRKGIIRDYSLKNKSFQEVVSVMNWKKDNIDGRQQVLLASAEELGFQAYPTRLLGELEGTKEILPLEKVYAYDPLPKQLDPAKSKLIRGVLASLWTQQLPTQEQVEYRVFPRLLALAELAWTPAEKRNWTDFQHRLQKHYGLLQQRHVHYAPPSREVGITGRYDLAKKQHLVTMTAERYLPDIHYTTDGSDPLPGSTHYIGPISFVNSTTIKAALFKDSMRLGDIAEYTVDIHKGIDRKIVYNTPWSTQYPVKSEMVLLNGQYGGYEYTDGEWQGFSGDLDVTLDFERREELHEIKLRFMQEMESDVYAPEHVKILASDDGKHFKEIQRISNDLCPTPGIAFKCFNFNLQGKLARYIRIVGENGRKGKGYLFTDEIVVY